MDGGMEQFPALIFAGGKFEPEAIVSFWGHTCAGESTQLVCYSLVYQVSKCEVVRSSFVIVDVQI